MVTEADPFVFSQKSPSLRNMATEIFKALHGSTPIYVRDIFEEKDKITPLVFFDCLSHVPFFQSLTYPSERCAPSIICPLGYFRKDTWQSAWPPPRHCVITPSFFFFKVLHTPLKSVHLWQFVPWVILGRIPDSPPDHQAGTAWLLPSFFFFLSLAYPWWSFHHHKRSDIAIQISRRRLFCFCILLFNDFMSFLANVYEINMYLLL